MVELTLSYYGPLRVLEGHALQMRNGSTVADAKAELMRRFPAQRELLRVSAFGDDREVLRDDSPLRTGAYSVLPPVSGG